MVDAHRRQRAHARMGAERHPEPGGLQHRQIVGAVADRQRLARVEPEPDSAGAPARRASPAAPRSSPDQLAGERGRPRSPARSPRHGRTRTARWTWRVNAVKPPETSAVKAPCARIVRTSVRAPGISRRRSLDHVARSPPAAGRPAAPPARAAPLAKSSSPFMARRVISAISRLDAGEVGKLVDALDGDDRAVHVAQQQPLAPLASGRHRDVRPAAPPSSGASGRAARRRRRALRSRSPPPPPPASQRALPGRARRAASATSARSSGRRAGVGDQAGNGRHGCSLVCGGGRSRRWSS